MIVVDPGHGGADPGCQVNGLVEKALTLHVALLLRDLAGAIHLPLRLTRDADETLSLAARGRRAAGFGADQVLCLHFDTNPDPAVGRLTCYCDERDLQSQGLAACVIAVAPPVLAQGCRVIFIEPTGWKRRACNVVRAYQAPALLIECSFLSNHQHQTFLEAPLGLPSLSTSLLNALLTAQHQLTPHSVMRKAAAPQVTHRSTVPKGLGPFTPQGKGAQLCTPKNPSRQVALTQALTKTKRPRLPF